MAQVDLLVLGGQGRVGQAMQRLWRAQDGLAVWHSRKDGDGPIPQARVVLVLSGVTRGTPVELAQNREIAQEAARLIRASGAGVAVYASTMAVYGRHAAGVSEEAPPQPAAPYGEAKLAAEADFLAAFADPAGPKPLVLRLGNVVGCDLLGELVEAGRDLVMDRFASGAGPVRSYLGAGLLVRLMRRLLAAEAEGPSATATLPVVLNVASQHPVDMARLLEAVGLPYGWRPAPPTALAEAVMDCSRLARLLPPCPAEGSLAGLAAEWRERLQ